MSSQEFIDKMKKIQESLLEFIDSQDCIEDKFQKLKIIFDNQKIRDNTNNLKLFFRILIDITNNHIRKANFYHKIELILIYFKKDIITNYSNCEIFNIFKKNKRVLLFLINECVLKIDHFVFQNMTDEKYIDYKYHLYLMPEIKSYLDENPEIKEEEEEYNDGWYKDINKELPENFYELRKSGENDNFICKLIREDSLNEFISFISQNNIPLNSKIDDSIYETNKYLIKNHPRLIEYSAFCGSIQIFKYLKSNGVEIDSLLWRYAIHGNNPEIIHIIEDKNMFLMHDDIIRYIKHSIKSHHNDLANYFINNNETNEEFIYKLGYQYYNFEFIKYENFNHIDFYYCCKYDYYHLASDIFNSIDININDQINDISNNMIFQ